MQIRRELSGGNWLKIYRLFRQTDIQRRINGQALIVFWYLLETGKNMDG
jgi:hypothetical protein